MKLLLTEKQILSVLNRGEKFSAKQMCEHLDMAPTTVRHALRYLRLSSLLPLWESQSQVGVV